MLPSWMMALILLNHACQPARPLSTTSDANAPTTQDNAAKVKLFLKSGSQPGQYSLLIHNPTSREKLEVCVDTQLPSLCDNPQATYAEATVVETKGQLAQTLKTAEFPAQLGTRIFVRSASASKLKLRSIELVTATQTPGQASPDGYALLEKYCKTCHSGNQAQGGWRLAVRVAVKDQKEKLLKQINDGSMPPQGKPSPTPQEKMTIIDFLNTL